MELIDPQVPSWEVVRPVTALEAQVVIPKLENARYLVNEISMHSNGFMAFLTTLIKCYRHISYFF